MAQAICHYIGYLLLHRPSVIAYAVFIYAASIWLPFESPLQI